MSEWDIRYVWMWVQPDLLKAIQSLGKTPPQHYSSPYLILFLFYSTFTYQHLTSSHLNSSHIISPHQILQHFPSFPLRLTFPCSFEPLIPFSFLSTLTMPTPLSYRCSFLFTTFPSPPSSVSPTSPSAFPSTSPTPLSTQPELN